MKAGLCSAPQCLKSLPRGDAVELGCEGWREVPWQADRAAAWGRVGTVFNPTPSSDLQADTIQGGHASPEPGGVGAPSTHAWALFCSPSLSPQNAHGLPDPHSCPHGYDPALGKGRAPFLPFHLTPVTTFLQPQLLSGENNR